MGLTAVNQGTARNLDSTAAWLQAFAPQAKNALSPEEALISLLDQCNVAAILLDTRFTCLAATSSAQNLIESDALFELQQTRLLCRLMPIGFRKALLTACKHRRAELQVVSSAHPASWQLLLTLVPDAALEHPRVLLSIVEDAANEGRVSAQRVQHRLGLTASEAALVAALSNGASTTEYAAQRNVSIHTVRNQLKSVYLKLDVHSQKDLIAAVIRICTLRDRGSQLTPSDAVRQGS